MRADIVPGAVFPDYELSDQHGTHRTLSALQQSDPLVLVLSRGGFCPKDRRQHEGLPHPPVLLTSDRSQHHQQRGTGALTDQKVVVTRVLNNRSRTRHVGRTEKRPTRRSVPAAMSAP